MNLQTLIRDAAEARSDLNNYHAIIALCENGLFTNPKGYKTQEKIIALCKAKSRKELQRHDKAVAAILAYNAEINRLA